RDLLVRIEAEDGRRPVPAERRALVLGSDRLRRVLDQDQPASLAERAQLVELAGVAEHVDRDDGLRPLRDRRLDGGRVEVQRPRIDVGKDRRRALEDEAVGRRHEGDRRGDRLVSGAQSGDVAEQVQSRRAARDRRRIGRTHPLGDQLLEAVDRWPEGQVTRAQHLEDELLLTLAHPGASERYVFSSRRSRLAILPSRAKGQTSYPENTSAFFGSKLLRAYVRRTRATAPSARCARARCRDRPPGARA